MNPQIKNIIMFAGIAVLLIFVYFFFIKGEPEEPNLVVPGPPGTTPAFPGGPISGMPPTGIPGGVVPSVGNADAITQEFLTILLNIRGLQLNGAIFAEPAFKSLRDSTIVLVPDGDEGRPNPFAPIGSDIILSPDALEGSAGGSGI